MPELPEDHLEQLREAMVATVVEHAVVTGDRTGRPRISARVLDAMRRVPRHHHVPAEMMPFAYLDTPLPIGFEKTISQPFIVGLMTELLDPGPSDRVLEVGTGLGYQAAVLAALAREVYSVELVEPLARGAARRLREDGVDNVQVRIGDGSRGWPERAPFDRILVAAAPELVPVPLLEQLAPGGRMVIPAGLDDAQTLLLVCRDAAGALSIDEILPVRFGVLSSV
ncbi:MAG: protein-L-isoaspartate(D-aspartate) O-methyltransferase [Ectothiorhodospiraceae bacterium]|nr:protein-L-isoaspartate(D-aspartate) O-methyltransferase [Chromatiales bacterium]MCP5157564.1 protein-L-isoaspartate(D-aspartate) O-methyltransferase [Ectothiorhodospiraceae bacterium]